MKIALITNLYEPYDRGGAEVIVKRTALELVKQGHEVSIITGKPWSGWASIQPSTEQKDRLTIIRYYPLNFFFYRNDYKWPLVFRLIWHLFDLGNMHSATTVKRILNKERPDLVMTHNLMGLGYFIPRVVRQLGIKHIHILHDIQLAVRSGVMKKGQEHAWFVTGFVAKVYQLFVKSVFGSPDIVVSPSKFLLNFYHEQGYFPLSKQIVLQNPVDDRFFSNNIVEKQGGGITFGYVGQLVEHKGLKTLLRAFSGLSDSTIRLSIVGSGPMQAEVESLAALDNRIELKGRIPNEQLPRYYQSVDIIIIPTETYENSPTVVFESLASGKPVIVSDIGGAAEQVIEGENGYVFQPGEVNDLMYVMKKVVKDPPVMSSNEQKKIRELGVTQYIQRLLKIDT